ncbi:MAG: hypothetical protein KBS91_04165 [Firmicutes bacterium]|nr:hypothetical protein [Candidatus Caballimonas caccae]
MKLTKTNLRKMKAQEPKNAVMRYVIDYVLEKYDDYDDKKKIFTDVLEHGCVSGIVGGLIYYSDTTKFYDKHAREINEMVRNEISDCGFNSPKDLFGDKWDENDPFVEDIENKNLLSWFGFECKMRDLYYEFYE